MSCRVSIWFKPRLPTRSPLTSALQRPAPRTASGLARSRQAHSVRSGRYVGFIHTQRHRTTDPRVCTFARLCTFCGPRVPVPPAATRRCAPALSSLFSLGPSAASSVGRRCAAVRVRVVAAARVRAVDVRRDGRAGLRVRIVVRCATTRALVDEVVKGLHRQGRRRRRGRSERSQATRHLATPEGVTGAVTRGSRMARARR